MQKARFPEASILQLHPHRKEDLVVRKRVKTLLEFWWSFEVN